ncbi:hypothetical protein Tco_0355600 [Tanacetum coccineum]
MGEGSANLTDPDHTPIITQPSSSQPQKKHKSRRPKEKDTQVPQSSVPSDLTNVADEDSIQLKELMDFCTKLHQRVLDLENTKTAKASTRIVSSDEASLGDQEDASKQGKKIHDIDADEDITLENVHDAEMFDVNDLHGDEVFVEKEVHVKEVSAVGKVNTASIATTVSAPTITKDEITLAQALAELKSVKPKVTTATTTTTKGILLQEPSESITTTTIPSKDKGKAKEQDKLTVDEKATLFQQLLKKRRKHFAAKRAEEKRNMPPTRAQQRSIMCTYLKNMAGWKPKDLKSKSFANIQELFNKAFNRISNGIQIQMLLGRLLIVPDRVEFRAYGRRWIRCIGNCKYAFSCEDLALIRRIPFLGYDVLESEQTEKTKAVMNMPSPSSLKQMQRLSVNIEHMVKVSEKPHILEPKR